MTPRLLASLLVTGGAVLLLCGSVIALVAELRQ